MGDGNFLRSAHYIAPLRTAYMICTLLLHVRSCGVHGCSWNMGGRVPTETPCPSTYLSIVADECTVVYTIEEMSQSNII